MLDRLGDWVAAWCTPAVQRKLGVLMCLISVPLMAWGPFSGEQFLIYEMSAGAILFTGISTIVAAVPSEEP